MSHNKKLHFALVEVNLKLILISFLRDAVFSIGLKELDCMLFISQATQSLSYFFLVRHQSLVCTNITCSLSEQIKSR